MMKQAIDNCVTGSILMNIRFAGVSGTPTGNRKLLTRG